MTRSGIRGSCLCGGVEFEISPPYLFFHYCHCSRCRKSSGSAHAANILLRKEQFAWTRGEELVRRWEHPGAKRFCTGFCDVCGSSLPWQSRNRKGYLVDMTGSGHRMTRPTIEQIWHVRYREGQNTGVLRPYERLTRERYVDCVTGVVTALHADGLLTDEARKWYIDKAKTDEIGVD